MLCLKSMPAFGVREWVLLCGTTLCSLKNNAYSSLCAYTIWIRQNRRCIRKSAHGLRNSASTKWIQVIFLSHFEVLNIWKKISKYWICLFTIWLESGISRIGDTKPASSRNRLLKKPAIFCSFFFSKTITNISQNVLLHIVQLQIDSTFDPIIFI